MLSEQAQEPSCAHTTRFAITTSCLVLLLTILQLNNSYGCQNSYTLNYLLKNELDFQGFGMNFSLSRSVPY
jgi:beta-glucosidase-like glycosyl hydrolase